MAERNFRQSIEDNPIIWLLGTLLAGFLAGIGTHKGLQEVAGIEPTSRAEVHRLRDDVSRLRAELERVRQSPGKLEPASSHGPFTALAGVRLRLVFRLEQSNEALAIKTRLAPYGVNVTFFSNNGPLAAPGTKWDVVYVGARGLLEAATLIRSELDEWGISEVAIPDHFKEGTSETGTEGLTIFYSGTKKKH